ncbi:hypothetical protein [Gracilimonas sp.]|uniref:hypothetical protein n=1 Tax=Gracilimonas sp. TaxID=1974203 RepID=UPI0028721D9E|nr:hypothetical protein [Gracilimonas sp.]
MMQLKSIAVIVLLVGLSPAEQNRSIQNVSEFTDGNITGQVVLTPRSSGNRFTGGMYGRPNQSTSSGSSDDSVLVVLTGAENAQPNIEKSPVILDQKNQQFIPSLLPVRQNQTVRIRNSDPVYHNVFSLSSPNKFDVGRRPKGEYLDVSFDEAGVVDVFCDIHSNMHAIIYVMPVNALQWVKIKSGDTFNLEAVPAGNYEIKIFALGYEERTHSVEIQSGKTFDIGTITMNR